MFKGKKGEDKIISWILVGAVIFLVYSLTATKVPVPAQAGVGGANGEQVAADGTFKIVGAPCTQSTTLSGIILRRYTDVAQTAQNVTLLQNGVERATIAHLGTTTVQSGANGDNLDLYVVQDGSTTFYTQHAKGRIKECRASATTGDPDFVLVQDSTVGGAGIVYSSDPHKVVQIDTAPSITVQNEDPVASNSQGGSGTNLTIGTGSSNTVTVTFRPTFETGIGVIGGNILTCQFPSAVYDQSNPVLVSEGGVRLTDSSISPSSTVYPLIRANNTIKSWKVRGIDGVKDTVVKFELTLRASSNNNPQENGLDNMNCTLFDTDYYKTKTGTFVLDIENRDTNVDLGGANSNYDWVVGVA